jgi:GLPGLI family protein
MKANYSKKPNAVVKKIFYNFEKNEHIEQKEFMTRFFLVESEIERKAWKLTNKKKKVLDYVCLGADLEIGDETITAWFTSEIPVSAGPGDYHGLPGLILGVEKNEEIFMLATSIDLTPPDESTLNQLYKGQKVSPEKFDQIVKEKMEEYQKMMQSKSKNKSKG